MFSVIKSVSGCLFIFLVITNAASLLAQEKNQLKTANTNAGIAAEKKNQTWRSDNGNGTFINPLFYDEFSDPDLIRVGDDYYLTGTTMHAMPGLPVLHSKDMVNWEFLTYAVNKLDFGPAYRLQDGKDIYGQGIWAPSFRYHNGTFYIFTNVNGQNTQLFTAKNPKGPWKQTTLKKSFHDLSVLFDDDGKVYVVWGYQELHLAELTADLTDVKPGTETIITHKGDGVGEGCHLYKIAGKYYITNTNYDPLCYQVCLRADKITGPYEVNVISAEENMGVGTGWRLNNTSGKPPFKLIPPTPNFVGCIPMHQGGIVQTQTGEWWGWSMMDYNSVGRVTCLSPVTWKDGWPYFGLTGNLTRSPRTWLKPATGFSTPPTATYERSDDFSASTLKPIWQWNHVPDDGKWSLTERKGYLRLHALPAADFWSARNSLTQRAVGPESVATAEMEISRMQNGDVAGLGLLNLPYAWIGITKNNNGADVKTFNQQTGDRDSVAIKSKRIWLRAYGNFDTDQARFSYSLDGKTFNLLGDTVVMPYQLRTFQGVRYALFNYSGSNAGGFVDYNGFDVAEPRSTNRIIPDKQSITLTSLADNTTLVSWNGFLKPVSSADPLAKSKSAQFRVLEKGKGRIALQSVANGGFVTVEGAGGMAQVRIVPKEDGERSLFQWEDMLRGDLMLLSVATKKYLFADPGARSLTAADALGTRPDRKDGACFTWNIISTTNE